MDKPFESGVYDASTFPAADRRYSLSPEDKEVLIDTGFRFVSWLRRHFPEVKDRLLENCVFKTFSQRIRQTPTLFWGDVGAQDFNTLTRKAASGESILDRVVETIRAACPAVRNEIIVGFVETHMCVWPDSELEDIVRHMLKQDCS